MPVSRYRILAARVLAVVADAVQLGLLPLFAPGATSPINDVLDVAVGAAMIALVGWNWVFLPTFLTELVPFVDLAPTWTIAAYIATRDREVKAEAEALNSSAGAELGALRDEEPDPMPASVRRRQQ